ncbi:uncharacterized protein LOC118232633 isoform X2 [Anguilla anguilla]|uniref:uncharacterized protein LOC118232633 isoform X2 n=1 Tax=Anguilla anguilla TaxID=7936 RepID=UPI0015B37C19|nr:uncharacterized protein LOC118232633 isoform X2 [Anguilla anguilla]
MNRKEKTMASSNQIVKVTKGLTRAADHREYTKLLMKPYANWEEYLTPAPLSIAILAELIFISSNTDFSIRQGGPEGGFQYIKYPDSFRACLMQVSNSGWRAFNNAHKNMDQIRLYTNSVQNYIKTAVEILLNDDDSFVQAMLPDQLDSIKRIASKCLDLAQLTEKSFIDVMELICELLETCISAKQAYGKALEEVRKTIEENKIRKKAAKEATKRAEQAYKNMNQQLKEAQESFKSAMDSIPSGWDMMGMNFVEGLTGSVTTTLSGLSFMVTAPVNLPAMIVRAVAGQMVKPDANNDQISANNIYSKSPQILLLVEDLMNFFDGDQIKWSEIVDQKTKPSKINWIKEQFVKIQESIKTGKKCKPKKSALRICTEAITICSELGKCASKAEVNAAETKEIVQLIKSLRTEAVRFDTTSKIATNTSAFSVKPPQITKTQEKSSGHRSAAQLVADNARLRIEQSGVQLEKARELYEKCVDNMEENKKKLTEILVTMRNCSVKEIDFNKTILILAQGLQAMANVKEQWEKLVRFFQMVSNLMESSLTESLTDFSNPCETALKVRFTYTSRMFLKDTIYNKAFYASNIASLVNMIAGTYVEVSDKYLMDAVSKLSTLMTLDAKDIEPIRKSMAGSFKEAEEGIRHLIQENKENFERKTMQRLEKIESELKAVLPPESEEKKRERKEVVEKASKNDQDVDQYF